MVAGGRAPEVEVVSISCRIFEAGVAGASLRGDSLGLESRFGGRAVLMEDCRPGAGLCICVFSGDARDVWLGQRRPPDSTDSADENHAEPAKKWGGRLMDRVRTVALPEE